MLFATCSVRELITSKRTTMRIVVPFTFGCATIISRMAIVFGEAATGWKSFSTVAALLVIGSTALVVHWKLRVALQIRSLGNTNMWCIRLARMVLLGFCSFVFFASYCVVRIPEVTTAAGCCRVVATQLNCHLQEIDRACLGLDVCQYRQHQTLMLWICSGLVLIAVPSLFLVLVSE